MAFIYDSKLRTAIDGDRKVEVKQSWEFTDSQPELDFIFSIEGKNFSFSAISREEPRRRLFKGAWIDDKLPTVVYIIERSLAPAFSVLLAGEADREARLASIKEDIKEGMFVLWTWGGKLLEFVPDFKVEFVHDRREALNK